MWLGYFVIYDMILTNSINNLNIIKLTKYVLYICILSWREKGKNALQKWSLLENLVM